MNTQHSDQNDLRPLLLAILQAGIRQADIARRLGVSRAMICDAAKPSNKPWMPTYANGRALVAMHREVCGSEGGAHA
ncbi:hypothetical protein L1889_03740 [Paenalcaligenes niemegkensis]|uniref:hypothetical protein n=1 Tax=Paenalcaligenes niemegkensis TaxID=2895469 RepID=UPI001EE97FAB|nr:hypothetical protein [Paenalcaligenes niemegkensis]MCQ9615922.1 hypothetical protein [Paenalcaligenes niemegkensis]